MFLIFAALYWNWRECSWSLLSACFCSNWWAFPRWCSFTSFWFPCHSAGR